ncbi:Complex III assembly factor lyrm7 [Clonorchis sinensis]|uniref:Complex III assembly factor LYRM7 n=1 Tax=Clonorchis sinensis TaxID=79923 RepID=A0A8T1MXY7_CLOSI|nr:Complex III assembly factor lyrm7 [Clonorchis sinensis]
MQRSRALKLLADLHRTCRVVFHGDESTLQAAKERIRAEFRANQAVTDSQKIEELLKYGEDVEMLLRTTVIQMEYNEKDNRFKLNLREGLAYGDNEPVTTKPPETNS